MIEREKITKHAILWLYHFTTIESTMYMCVLWFVFAEALESTNHIQIFSSEDIIDTVLSGKRILQSGTGFLCLLDRDGGLSQTTTAGFRDETLFWELGFGNVMEQHVVDRLDLPLVSKLDKVVNDSRSVTGQKSCQSGSPPLLVRHTQPTTVIRIKNVICCILMNSLARDFDSVRDIT